ncbi:hypothetical protein [Pseudohongiella sp.]|uniref:Uncharacterized protein n=1 Tax=marine sediment metagenome TaxID=412755 RepID=A0A0F9Z353_9ZZZZ|nr:hypothetical protein [Pseudohongiella sp.]HDZ09198.1 hypothetical protein [Pseudohongiella sp.]
MNKRENTPNAAKANQDSSQKDLQIEILTEALGEILRELDADLYQCVACISALSAGKPLTPADKAMMLAVARRVHGLARLQQHG